MLAPPWIPIPPPAYGGIEEVVRLLCEGLIDRGHDVTLFAPPGSSSRAEVRTLLAESHPDKIESSRIEADHVSRAFDEIETGTYDLVHDHTGFVALAMAHRLPIPFVHTLHGPFDEAACAFYRTHGSRAQLVALSGYQRDAAPAEAGVPEVVPNPLAVEEWPFQAEKDDFVLWIGRMSPDKGPDRAIAAARLAGVRILLAGPVQPGQERYFAEAVEPCLGKDGVEYVGEADAERKRDLYRRARAFLMPIRWPEPFGLVMVEAMACGTPVIAFPEGSVPEIVVDGESGFVVGDEEGMAAAIGRLGELDPARCRELTESRFGVAAVAERYEAVYRHAVGAPVAAAAPAGAA
jgi:glycosyltransferase involved in cell wall biosynthesis